MRLTSRHQRGWSFTVPGDRGEQDYVLLDAAGRPHRSVTPGCYGGHRRSKIYGRLDCPAALRAIAAGGYVRHRVFFTDEASAVAAGYRPCAVCLTDDYRRWTNGARAVAADSGCPAVAEQLLHLGQLLGEGVAARPWTAGEHQPVKSAAARSNPRCQRELEGGVEGGHGGDPGDPGEQQQGQRGPTREGRSPRRRRGRSRRRHDASSSVLARRRLPLVRRVIRWDRSALPAPSGHSPRAR